MNETPFLSLIIPAYNEGNRLPTTLPQVIAFAQAQPFPVEVIVVDNNSRDDTAAIAAEFAAQFPFVHLLSEPIQGKGAAVRAGMAAACGNLLFMADADLSMPVEEVSKFLPPLGDGWDIAIASREVKGAVRYNEPAYRHFMGRIFNFLVRAVAVRGFQDTQCGFKCFRRDVLLDILPGQTIEGWAFDVELLHIAQKRGYLITEVPIDWYYRHNSRVNPLRDSLTMLREVLRIRLNSWRGRYDPAPGHVRTLDPSG